MPELVIKECPSRRISSQGESHFFGYYDKSPWNAVDSDAGILAHGSRLHRKMPKAGEAVRLGVIGAGGAFSVFAESRAWNFQQGSMLQWRPGHASEALFNDEIDGRAVGVRVDVLSGVRQVYERPFASVSPKGTEALSIDFGRLTAIKPEYGYVAVRDEFEGEAFPAESGIWHIDLATGEVRRLISMRQIVEFEADKGLLESVHYLNHVMYSRTGERFCFLHRYINAAGTQNTRMFSCNRDGSDLRLLVAGMASHFGWRNDAELLAWAGQRKLMSSATKGGVVGRLPIGPILKKLYRALGKPAVFKAGVLNDRYILFDTPTGGMRTIGKGILSTDGHCSFSADGAWFVTDTYPDRKGRASLLICHLESETVYRVGRFVMPPELDGEIRCDLHPRWHPSRPLICVDVATDSERQLYEVDVSSVVALKA